MKRLANPSNSLTGYIAGEVIPGERISWYSIAAVDGKTAGYHPEALDNQYATTFTMPVAVVNPDARAGW